MSHQNDYILNETILISIQVKDACFCFIEPSPLENPCLISASKEALTLINLHPDELARKEFVDYFRYVRCARIYISDVIPLPRHK